MKNFYIYEDSENFKLDKNDWINLENLYIIKFRHDFINCNGEVEKLNNNMIGKTNGDYLITIKTYDKQLYAYYLIIDESIKIPKQFEFHYRYYIATDWKFKESINENETCLKLFYKFKINTSYKNLLKELCFLVNNFPKENLNNKESNENNIVDNSKKNDKGENFQNENEISYISKWGISNYNSVSCFKISTVQILKNLEYNFIFNNKLSKLFNDLLSSLRKKDNNNSKAFKLMDECYMKITTIPSLKIQKSNDALIFLKDLISLTNESFDKDSEALVNDYALNLDDFVKMSRLVKKLVFCNVILDRRNEMLLSEIMFDIDLTNIKVEDYFKKKKEVLICPAEILIIKPKNKIVKDIELSVELFNYYNQRFVYKLNSLLIHYGSFYGGHNFCYSYLQNKWLNFNDNLVVQKDPITRDLSNVQAAFYKISN
jgi:hypothetical protein